MSKSDLETRSREKPNVNRDDIRRGLETLGVRPGDLLVVHSSLSSFGYVEGGADAVIDGVLEAVGERGTVIITTATDCDKFDFEAYDPATTPVRKDIGTIPDTFWRRPDVRRGTYPPRHSWAGKGLLSDGIIEYSENHPIEAGNFLDMLRVIAELDGRVLLMGCGNRNNTSIHSAQLAAYNEVENATKVQREFLRSNPTRPEDFEKVDDPLLEGGIMRKGKIGNADISLMPSQGLFAVVKTIYETRYRDVPYTLPGSNDVADPETRVEKFNRVVNELSTLRAAG